MCPFGSCKFKLINLYYNYNTVAVRGSEVETEAEAKVETKVETEAGVKVEADAVLTSVPDVLPFRTTRR